MPSYPSGPCLLIRKVGATYIGLIAQAGVKIDEVSATFWTTNTFQGNAAMHLEKIAHTVSFVPDGRINANQIAALFEPLSLVPGQALFADSALTIIDINGNQWLYGNAAVTKMPDLNLSSKSKGAFGSVTFTCIPASASAPATANSLMTPSTGVTFPGWFDTYTAAAGVYTGSAAYDKSQAIAANYNLAWKDATGTAITGFASFYGRMGTKVTLGMTTQEIADDINGIGNMLVTGFGASCTLMPQGPTDAQMLANLLHQGTGAVIGGILTRNLYTLVITGPTGALKITLNDAGLVKSGLNYSVGAPRQDEAQWVAAPDLTTGANVNPVVVQIV